MNKIRIIKNIGLHLLCLFFITFCLKVHAQIPSQGTVAGSTLSQEAQKAIHDNLPFSSVPKVKEVNNFFYYIFLVMALMGVVPVIVFFIEHNLSGIHAFINHWDKCKDCTPNVAVIIPAWNEAMVLEHTIDLLLKIDYPLAALRLYIIDDGSTDNTAELLARKNREFPENVFHIRKESGGKGKAHAVNYGLDIAMADPWTEAFLLIDADISFTKDALRRMVRHLPDPEVGAVTAYIKVGNRDTNYISRTVGYEYIVSQSIARRAQNVLGVIACLAGGAQLHTRANIVALGNRLNTSTLAEDTYTTLTTQKLGKKVIYEGNAYVYAEEPTTICDIYKQRFRWARGNLQISKAFKEVWFRPSYPLLGNVFFGIIWFCVLLTPIFMILSAIGLISLYFLDSGYSSHVFFYLASISFFVYMYTTIFALLVDRRTSRLSWLEGIVYPGLVSISILIFSINPAFFFNLTGMLLGDNTIAAQNGGKVLLFMESWSALCMLCAWLIFRMEYLGFSKRISNFLLIIVGYGPFLCMVNLTAYIAEIKKPNLRWDKTDKPGSKRIIRNYPQPVRRYNFEQALKQDRKREYLFFFREIMSLLIVATIFILLNFL